MIAAKDAQHFSQALPPLQSALQIVQNALGQLPPVEMGTASRPPRNAAAAAEELIARIQRVRRMSGAFSSVEVSVYVDALSQSSEKPS
jgi:hypothetical protein